MKEPNWKNCSIEEFWKYVAWHLAANQIDAVLVGGAVASIYTKGEYLSGDLDIIIGPPFPEKVDSVLKEAGFVKQGRYYAHPKCDEFFLDFPPDPPAIGEDIQIRPKKIQVEGKALKLYSPTDCIRDRLASYIHFQDRDSLDQAVLVALHQPFNSQKIKKWCLKENAKAAFEDFLAALKAERS
jgi:hypothetical protein